MHLLWFNWYIYIYIQYKWLKQTQLRCVKYYLYQHCYLFNIGFDLVIAFSDNWSDVRYLWQFSIAKLPMPPTNWNHETMLLVAGWIENPSQGKTKMFFKKNWIGRVADRHHVHMARGWMSKTPGHSLRVSRSTSMTSTCNTKGPLLVVCSVSIKTPRWRAWRVKWTRRLKAKH